MKRLRVILPAAIFLLACGFVWWRYSTSPIDPKNTKTRVFVIEKGDGIKEISKNLTEQGFIHDRFSFFIYERLFAKKNLQAGSFQLSPSMSVFDIADKLTLGQEDIWVTIPEGWRSEQILELLGKKGDWKADEGKYFPETYRVPKDIDLEDFRQLLLKTFAQKVPSITRDQLIVASLIEREAKNSTDRPLIASVIYNRLEA
ncbi:endolytic transglycosylase MltG, partial [Candidatus Microgenomates bacterium]|nr:endolytic transglycosylase MltG [Candidatus Microgenomates bacterium]